MDRQQWEYLFEEMNQKDYKGCRAEKPIFGQSRASNRLGEQGWEMIAIWRFADGFDIGVYKRLKEKGEPDGLD